MNAPLYGVTTGIGGIERHFAGAQRSSSHIVFARIHMIEVFVYSPPSSHQRVSSLVFNHVIREDCTLVRRIKSVRKLIYTDPNKIM